MLLTGEDWGSKWSRSLLLLLWELLLLLLLLCMCQTCRLLGFMPRWPSLTWRLLRLAPRVCWAWSMHHAPSVRHNH